MRRQTDESTDKEERFPLRDEDFKSISRLLYRETGIALGNTKKDMVASRLAKRLRHHRLHSFDEYIRHLLADIGDERQEFINCLTTNKTDFFREFHHFEFLRNVVIPQARAAKRRLRIWSAGCSTGEEPYSLAMTLRESCPASEGWDIRLLATDIDTAVLQAGEQGVYAADRMRGVSAERLRRWFRREAGSTTERYQVRPELRDLITFRQLNFMAEPWPIQTRFSAIFCRNVIIYFDRPTQAKLMERFARHLEPQGYLVLGHSENLSWLTQRYRLVGPTVYQLVQDLAGSGGDGPATTRASAAAAPAPTVAPPAEEAGPEHNLILGDVKTVKGPATLKTLLGSCVAACIFDPVAQVGGMNHFSLPGVADAGVNARYGAHAMELLITDLMKKGADRTRLRAKVFGGAKVLAVEGEGMNVGERNAAFVLEFLEQEGIPVLARCLGGNQGLLVHFRPHRGQARVKPLTMRDLSGVVKAEQKYSRELLQKASGPPADDAITLF